MITRIEIDGFKTFKAFKLDLAPFQVIVGANGAGKSNLFDALRLLADLADHDLRSAFQNLRGDAGELFMLLPNGQYTNKMQLAVELFVERQVQDSWGTEADIEVRRLRYELELARQSGNQGLERLHLLHECLTPIAPDNDLWLQQQIIDEQQPQPRPFARSPCRPLVDRGSRREPFISTDSKEGRLTISLHQDGDSGGKSSVAQKVERTILSGVTNTEFPHAFAAREEMRSWKFLQLNPEVLREPSSMLARPFISPDGSNLPTALARMQAEEPYILNDLSRDIANLVPGMLKIYVEKDVARDQYIIQAKTQDGRTFSSRVLSDGTLRLLALVALKNDPQHSGVLCFEEPENGVHPFRLKNLVYLLSELATDFSEPEQAEEPLRQLLVNTHSPVLVSQFVQSTSNKAHKHTQLPAGLLFAYITTRIQPGNLKPLRVTRVIPVISPYNYHQLTLDLGVNEPEVSYTLKQVIDYLNSADVGEAVDTLQGGVN
jgi:predicted ATPase